MKMDKIAGSKNDEFYTPSYAVKPLLKYLKPASRIWCPFDKKNSWFVKILKEEKHDVIFTHIENGEDFFEVIKTIDLNQFDYIISNPPYSKKTEVLKTLFQCGKPFAMLLGVVGLFESKERFNLFKYNKFEILYFDKRISYFKDMEEQTPSMNPPFSSVYITKHILPQKIVFEEIQKTKKIKGEN